MRRIIVFLAMLGLESSVAHAVGPLFAVRQIQADTPATYLVEMSGVCNGPECTECTPLEVYGLDPRLRMAPFLSYWRLSSEQLKHRLAVKSEIRKFEAPDADGLLQMRMGVCLTVAMWTDEKQYLPPVMRAHDDVQYDVGILLVPVGGHGIDDAFDFSVTHTSNQTIKYRFPDTAGSSIPDGHSSVHGIMHRDISIQFPSSLVSRLSSDWDSDLHMLHPSGRALVGISGFDIRSDSLFEMEQLLVWTALPPVLGWIETIVSSGRMRVLTACGMVGDTSGNVVCQIDGAVLLGRYLDATNRAYCAFLGGAISGFEIGGGASYVREIGAGYFRPPGSNHAEPRAFGPFGLMQFRGFTVSDSYSVNCGLGNLQYPGYQSCFPDQCPLCY